MIKSTKFIIVIAVLGLLSTTELLAQEVINQKASPKLSFDKLLTSFDKNKDEKLSKDEVKGALEENFKKIDLNKDGFISREEFDDIPEPPKPQ